MRKFLCFCFGSFLLLAPICTYGVEREIVYQDGEFAVDLDDALIDDIVWMPGDTICQSYIVKNHSKETIRMYIEISTNAELSDTMQEWIQISVSSKENGWYHVFQAANEEDGFVNESIEIGTFVPGQVKDLSVELTLLENADNQCKDIVTELEYEFVAETIEDAEIGVPGTGDGRIDYYLYLLVIGALLFLFLSVFHRRHSNNFFKHSRKMAL